MKKIKLVVSDFDGVMTDNRILMDETGKESVFFSRADGMGINIIKDLNIPFLILSTEQNPVVGKRAEKLKVEVLQGIINKEKALINYCLEREILLQDVLYIGNDINDLEVMKIVGICVVPSDAYEVVKQIADIKLKTQGGFGVIRELADLLKSHNIDYYIGK